MVGAGQEGGRHLPSDCQDGERQPREEQTPLDDDEEPASIEGISQDTTDVGEQDIRQRIGCLD